MPLGSGHITKTTADVFIPELWRDEVQSARERKLVMRNLVRTYNHPAHSGDVLNVPLVSNLSPAQDVASETPVNFEAITESSIQVQVDKQKAKAIAVESIVALQSKYDLRQLYTEKLGYELARIIDVDLLSLYADVTQSTGAGGIDIDEDNIIEASEILDKNDVPPDDRVFVIYPDQKSALLRIPRLSEYYATGKGGAMLPGEFGYEIHGFKVFVSNNVQTDVNGHRMNLAFHRDAFLLAIGKEMEVETERKVDYLVDVIVAWEVYGVETMRPDHAVIVKS